LLDDISQPKREIRRNAEQAATNGVAVRRLDGDFRVRWGIFVEPNGELETLVRT
jgi:hypothetical protein